MNKNIKRFYIGFLNKINEQVHIKKIGSSIKLEQFFITDQTMGWEHHIYLVLDKSIVFQASSVIFGRK